jgi:hypothetical protein
LPLLLFWFIVTLLLLQIEFLFLVAVLPACESRGTTIIFLLLSCCCSFCQCRARTAVFFPIHRPFAAIVNLLSVTGLVSSPHTRTYSCVPFFLVAVLPACASQRQYFSCCCSCGDFFVCHPSSISFPHPLSSPPASPHSREVVSSWTTLLPYGSPRGLWLCTHIWLVHVFHRYSFECVEALDALDVREASIRPNRSLLAILMKYGTSDYHIDYSSCFYFCARLFCSQYRFVLLTIYCLVLINMHNMQRLMY